MTHPDQERNFDHGTSCTCEANSNSPCSQIDFPIWLESKLAELELNFEDFKTMSSLKNQLGR
jgi:hypothetical protein